MSHKTSQIFDNAGMTVIVLQYKREHAKKSPSVKKLNELASDIAVGVLPMVKYAVDHFVRGASPETKEDMVQECWLKISKNIHKFDPKRGKLHSYLTTLIQHMCKDVQKSEVRRRAHETATDTVNDSLTPENTQGYTSLSQCLEADSLADLKGLIPFPVSTEFLDGVFDILVRHKFKVHPGCVDALVTYAVSKNIDVIAHGMPEQFANSLVMAIRWALIQSHPDTTPAAEAVHAQIGSTRFTEIDVLGKLMGQKAAVHTTLLFSGLTVKFPVAPMRAPAQARSAGRTLRDAMADLRRTLAR